MAARATGTADAGLRSALAAGPVVLDGGLATTLEANREWLSASTKRLDTMGDRPQRVASCC